MLLPCLNLNCEFRLYFLAAALVVSSCNLRVGGKWEVVHNENLAHAAAVGPILFDDKQVGWALTWAELFRVRDQGRSWIPVLKTDGERRAFYSFTFTTPTTGTVVGAQKKAEGYTVLILQTSDGGESWHEKATDVAPVVDRHERPALQSVTFCGAKSGWAVGNDLILHTTDGGLTWATQRSDLNGESLFTIACTSSERAWTVGTGGLLLRTIDGGNSWAHQVAGTREILIQVRFFGENGWIIGGTNGTAVLLRTRDRGETWQPQQLPVTTQLFDIFFLDNYGWIAGEKGTLLRSDDGGETWSPQKTPTNEDLTSLYFLSPNQGWVGGNRLTLLRFSG
jgi:photosystem II stability/assembly factor-like uncharacterized protein